jgi:HEAT repeat protein
VKKVWVVWMVLLLGCGEKSTTDRLEQLRSPEAAQRLHAVKALGENRSEASRVVPALARALEDEDAFVRRDAAQALGQFGPEGREALPALRALLKDRNAAVRRAASGALKKIDPEEAARTGGR